MCPKDADVHSPRMVVVPIKKLLQRVRTLRVVRVKRHALAAAQMGLRNLRVKILKAATKFQPLPQLLVDCEETEVLAETSRSSGIMIQNTEAALDFGTVVVRVTTIDLRPRKTVKLFASSLKEKV